MQKSVTTAFVTDDERWLHRLREWRALAPEVLAPYEFSRFTLMPPTELQRLKSVVGIIVDGCTDSHLAVAECARVGSLRVPIGLLTSRPLETSALARAGVRAWLIPPCSAPEMQGFFASLYATETSKSGTILAVRPRMHLAPEVELDRTRRTLFVKGREEALPAQKFDLLCYLVDHAGVAVTAAELVQRGLLRPSQAFRLKGLVQELRGRLGPARTLLKAVSGYGYRFDLAPLDAQAGT